MNQKVFEILTAVLFCGFLGAMSLLYLLLPEETFSDREKRYLAQAPAMERESIASGEWGADAETYMADHIPGRDFFVGLNAYTDLLTGRQVSKDIRVWKDYLLEAPKTPDFGVIDRNMEKINGFADLVDQPVDLMIVPSTGWAAGLPGYEDDAVVDRTMETAGENVIPVDLRPVFAGRPELFYRTDHHWNSEGAYRGCAAYLSHLGLEPREEESFQREDAGLFQGSTYSRSALWLTPGEPMELWVGSEELTAVNGENPEPHAGVLYRERLEELDKYTVFLDGNHSLVRVTNPHGEGKLLVIRDSFSNSLGCYLGESFGEVVLADLRYYKQPLSQLVEQEGFDRILVCYSTGNFLTDTNIVMLR